MRAALTGTNCRAEGGGEASDVADLLVGFLGPVGVTAGRWRVVVALGLLELTIGLDIPTVLVASALDDVEPNMLVVVFKTDRSRLPKASSSWSEVEISTDVTSSFASESRLWPT